VTELSGDIEDRDLHAIDIEKGTDIDIDDVPARVDVGWPPRKRGERTVLAMRVSALEEEIVAVKKQLEWITREVSQVALKVQAIMSGQE
jgi:hypothetical protein